MPLQENKEIVDLVFLKGVHWYGAIGLRLVANRPKS